jgi:aminodeoxyfutalosine deaminase
MFNTDLNREYLIAHDVFGVTRAGLVDLARESVLASFATPVVRARLLDEIDAYAASTLR